MLRLDRETRQSLLKHQQEDKMVCSTLESLPFLKMECLEFGCTEKSLWSVDCAHYLSQSSDIHWILLELWNGDCGI